MNKKIISLAITLIVSISFLTGVKFGLASSNDDSMEKNVATPKIKIIYPNGGEKWTNDKESKIEWQTEGISKNSYLTFRLRRVNGEMITSANEFGSPQATQIINSGSAVITPDSDICPDGSYKIEIEAYINNVQYIDYSDAPFTITSASSQAANDVAALSSDNSSSKETAKNSDTLKSSVTTESAKSVDQITQINNNASLLASDNVDEILSGLNQVRNTVEEQKTENKYLEKLASDEKGLTEQVRSAITNFITYGVDSNTQKLGAGERAAVMSSYKEAFGKLPETETELADAIKIANGRFPSTTSAEAEKYATEQFVKIYLRQPDLNNSRDNAAIKIMAYGLRQKAENRNLNSESVGIKTFRNIFGRVPQSTQDWNIMQAITYSGATR